MQDQVETLSNANTKLGEIYSTLKTLTLTGVIEENVSAVTKNINSLEARSAQLAELNDFDQKFGNSLGVLHSVMAKLEFLHTRQHIRNLYHYFDRKACIKDQGEVCASELDVA